MGSDSGDARETGRAIPVRVGISVLLAVLALAALVRGAGLTREPYWLDEIFTVQFTDGTLAEALEHAAADVHPPMYFAGLWAVRQAGIGASEAGIRAYSTAWSLLGVLVLAGFVGRLCASWSAAWVAGLLAAVHPLDVYFAQESRMYAQAAALAILSTWVLVEWIRISGGSPSRRLSASLLVGFVVVTGLLVQTHYVAIMVVAAQAAGAGAWLAVSRRWRSVGLLGCGLLASVVALVPWLVYVRRIRGAAYSDNISWIPAPQLRDFWLLLTRDLVWGRAGWPVGTWIAATAVSLTVLAGVLVFLVWRVRADGGSAAVTAEVPKRSEIVFLLWMVLGPVVIAMLASVVLQPVFYRPRFCSLVLAPFLAVLAIAIWSVPRRRWTAAAVVALCAVFSVGSARQFATITKSGMRDFVVFWEEQGPPEEMVFFPQWGSRVATYYFQRPVYQPKRHQIERRLRDAEPLVLWVCSSLGLEPARGTEDWDYRSWLLGLGAQKKLGVVDRMRIVEVTARPSARTYPSLPADGTISFGAKDSEPYLWNGWWYPEQSSRWSRGHRSDVVFGLTEPQVATLELEMFCLGTQRVGVELNGRRIADVECRQRAVHQRVIEIPPGVAGTMNDLVFHLPDAVAPREISDNPDGRVLAIGIRRLRVE